MTVETELAFFRPYDIPFVVVSVLEARRDGKDGNALPRIVD